MTLRKSLLLGCICFGLAAPMAHTQSTQSDPVVALASDDPVMAGAIAEARDHLDLFLSHLSDADGLSRPGGFLKVAVPTPGMSVDAEHVWVAPFRFQGDEFVGILTSAPAHFSHTGAGEPLRFTRAQISDWGYDAPDGLFYGFYTSRVITAGASPEDAAEYRDLFAPNPLPANW